jgi:hypothetical protein
MPAPLPDPLGIDERGRVRRGKLSAAWTGAVVAAVLLIALMRILQIATGTEEERCGTALTATVAGPQPVRSRSRAGPKDG